jgi:mono/diheme cytochrome c family protein
MKKFFTIAAIVLAVVAALLLGFLGYVVIKYPDAGPPAQLTITATPERLARGAYLANHVTVCIDCHSTRDWTKFSGPLIPGTEGNGGLEFGREMGFPGTIYASNITPASLGTMSDGELLRAIASGVGTEGRALFPIMPYPSYDKLSEVDLASIIAYIRTLKPIHQQIPERKLDFPLNLLVRTIPAPHHASPPPDTSDILAYGKYLANAATCIDCHTQHVKGKMVPGMEFAGGAEFRLSDGTIRSSNITPDEATGIGAWTKEIFLAKFKLFEHPDSTSLSIAAMGFPSVMPWTMYAGMTGRDLEAIFAYLKAVPPKKNAVERWTPKTAAQPGSR